MIFLYTQYHKFGINQEAIPQWSLWYIQFLCWLQWVIEWTIVIACISEQNQIYEGVDHFLHKVVFERQLFYFLWLNFLSVYLTCYILALVAWWSADAYVHIVMIQAHSDVRLALV